MQVTEGSLTAPLPVRMFRELAGHWNLIRQFAWREVVTRYKGSFFGILWSFVVPLFMLAIYVLVFGYIFPGGRFGPTDTKSDFALKLFCGLIVFNVFGECVQRAPGLVLAYPNYVKRVVFPLQIMPVVALGSSLINAGFSLVILLPAWAAVHHSVSGTIWLFPLMLVPLCALTLGLGWALSSLGVFIRDLAQPIFVLVQALFFLSGIFFSVDNVPHVLRIPMLINPLTTILENSRRTLLLGQWPDWTWWGAVTAGSLVVMMLGYYGFMRSKKAFADVM
jgi:lipopolysaccharide transport system permease protein